MEVTLFIGFLVIAFGASFFSGKLCFNYFQKYNKNNKIARIFGSLTFVLTFGVICFATALVIISQTDLDR